MALAETSDDRFDADVLKASGPVVVDFWAEWCTSCKAMMPHLEAPRTSSAARSRW